MKESYSMNSYLYEAWKKAGLSDEDAKKAAMEAARNEAAIAILSQSMAEFRTNVEIRIAEGYQRTINTVLIAIGVAATFLSLVVTLVISLT